MLIHQSTSVFKTAAQGMQAQRMVLGAVANNIANVNTTQTEEGGPYRVKRAVHENPEVRYGDFYNLLSRMQGRLQTSSNNHLATSSIRRSLDDGGVGPQSYIEELKDKVRMEYDPTHPHADAEGKVYYPDVDVVEEMTRMMSANRLYEANMSVVQSAKEMIKKALEI